MTQCDHYACRCARADELAQMADRTGNVRWLVEAIGVHGTRVECRRTNAWRSVNGERRADNRPSGAGGAQPNEPR